MRDPMKRICALDVVTAYKETGLIPIRKAWMSEDDRGGCALDALGAWHSQTRGEDWADENLDSTYIKGFIDAWDSDEPLAACPKVEDSDKIYLMGYWDAILCRDAIDSEFNTIHEVGAN